MVARQTIRHRETTHTIMGYEDGFIIHPSETNPFSDNILRELIEHSITMPYTNAADQAQYTNNFVHGLQKSYGDTDNPNTVSVLSTQGFDTDRPLPRATQPTTAYEITQKDTALGYVYTQHHLGRMGVLEYFWGAALKEALATNESLHGPNMLALVVTPRQAITIRALVPSNAIFERVSTQETTFLDILKRTISTGPGTTENSRKISDMKKAVVEKVRAEIALVGLPAKHIKPRDIALAFPHIATQVAKSAQANKDSNFPAFRELGIPEGTTITVVNGPSAERAFPFVGDRIVPRTLKDLAA